MKTKILFTLFVSTFIIHPSSFAQGALTPPGAPAATMKTLDQIEPRTPVDATHTPGNANNLYIISQPGSYYLTTNLVGVGNESGIEILANNVTLDLNGFTMQGVSTSTTLFLNDGILILNSQTNITVRNGKISNWAQGVLSWSAASANLVFERLDVANCYLGTGFAAAGMDILGGAVVRDCTFEANYYGLSCNNNNNTAPTLISACTASDSFADGISCGGSGIISGCTVNNNQTGIYISGGQGCVVSGCIANNNLYGIYVYAAKSRVEDNHVISGNGAYSGIDVVGGGSNTNNIIIKNSASGLGANNYSISSGQIAGPTITTTGTITNSNPWANFSF